MEVSFRTRQLERAFRQGREAARRWGSPAARKYVARVLVLAAARDFEAVRAIVSLRAHPLKGDRRGQWALDMTDSWRLIVTPSRDGTVVRIEEVSRHYGD